MAEENNISEKSPQSQEVESFDLESQASELKSSISVFRDAARNSTDKFKNYAKDLFSNLKQMSEGEEDLKETINQSVEIQRQSNQEFNQINSLLQSQIDVQRQTNEILRNLNNNIKNKQFLSFGNINRGVGLGGLFGAGALGGAAAFGGIASLLGLSPPSEASNLSIPQQNISRTSVTSNGREYTGYQNQNIYAPSNQQLKPGSLSGGATIPSNLKPETLNALNNVARNIGVDPAAVAMVIDVESKWNPRTGTGSYRGLTQIGPQTFREAGGKLGGLTWNEFLNASRAQQLVAYQGYLEHYGFKKQLNELGINISDYDIPTQAAILQGMQFSPYGKDWKRALASGNTDVRTTIHPQARVLGSTSISDMRSYFARTLNQNQPSYNQNISTPSVGEAGGLRFRQFPIEGMSWEDVQRSGGSQNSRVFGGPRAGGQKLHTGMDIGSDPGTPLMPMMEGGVVTRIARQKGGYGNLIDIRYPDQTVHRAAHLQSINQNLEVGSKVSFDQPFATSGYSGNAGANFPHTHYEVIKQEAYEAYNRLPPGRAYSEKELYGLRIPPTEYFKTQQERLASSKKARARSTPQASSQESIDSQRGSSGSNKLVISESSWSTSDKELRSYLDSAVKKFGKSNIIAVDWPYGRKSNFVKILNEYGIAIETPDSLGVKMSSDGTHLTEKGYAAAMLALEKKYGKGKYHITGASNGAGLARGAKSAGLDYDPVAVGVKGKRYSQMESGIESRNIPKPTTQEIQNQAPPGAPVFNAPGSAGVMIPQGGTGQAGRAGAGGGGIAGVPFSVPGAGASLAPSIPSTPAPAAPRRSKKGSEGSTNKEESSQSLINQIQNNTGQGFFEETVGERSYFESIDETPPPSNIKFNSNVPPIAE